MLKDSLTLPDSFIIRRPDDWHLHLREGALLKAVLPYSSAVFKRALVMPNLIAPITSVEKASAYRQEILSLLPADESNLASGFQPIMALYLTPDMALSEVKKAKESDFILGFKYYPKGATTHSVHGIEDPQAIYPLLAEMEELGLHLMIHGELCEVDVDIFDREKAFIDVVLRPIVEKFPSLKITLEHITTKEAVDFILDNSTLINNRFCLAGSITVHHLLLNRNDLFSRGIRPHYFCYPILKRDKHRLALIEALSSRSKQFFLGTDSAPHTIQTKEAACGCAGIFTAPAALPLYAEVFARCDILSYLEAFASENGADFYGLPRNQEKIKLIKKEYTLPAEIKIDVDMDKGADDTPLGVMPFRAEEKVFYQVEAIV